MINLSKVKPDDVFIVTDQILQHIREVHVFEGKLCKIVKQTFNNHAYLEFLDPEVQKQNRTGRGDADGWNFGTIDILLDYAPLEPVSPGVLYNDLLD